MHLCRYIKENKDYSLIIIAVYILSFAGASYNHITDILKGGPLPYDNRYPVPFLLNLYWTSLTVLDPLAIIVLLLNVRVGLIFYLGIMVSDVGINIYANIVYWKNPLMESTFLILQSVFFVFLLLTYRTIWHRSQKTPEYIQGCRK